MAVAISTLVFWVLRPRGPAGSYQLLGEHTASIFSDKDEDNFYSEMVYLSTSLHGVTTQKINTDV
jgi:hypothetical protein